MTLDVTKHDVATHYSPSQTTTNFSLTVCQFKDMSNDIESADVIFYVCCVGP